MGWHHAESTARLQVGKPVPQEGAKRGGVSDSFGNQLYLSPRSAITKNHRLGDLNNNFIISQFWSLEVQAQGVSRLGFS